MRIGRVDFSGSAEPAVAHEGLWIRASACGGATKEADVAGLVTQVEALREALDGLDLDELTAAGDAVPQRDVKLLAPIVGARSIVAVGLNYQEHASEVRFEAPPVPLLFAKWPSSLSGSGDAIPLDRSLTQQLDYEVELAAVIGRTAYDVPVDQALGFVGGYAVANDVSARDIQFSDTQWTRAKSFDGYCPVGPWVTTADEVPDPQALRLTCRVNGEVRQDASTGQMIHTVAELISYASRAMTLRPGDLILTGTPKGVAMGAEDPRWLQPGDVVESEVERLGWLRNEVVDRTVQR
jgi:2-keto-4-pentenoate hydratase/2-oxohepta-3-ene-1,7-dioic acid hydratase in catechol pathway